MFFMVIFLYLYYFALSFDFVVLFVDSFSDFIFILNDFPSAYPNTEATVVAEVTQLER